MTSLVASRQKNKLHLKVGVQCFIFLAIRFHFDYNVHTQFMILTVFLIRTQAAQALLMNNTRNTIRRRLQKENLDSKKSLKSIK